MAPDEYIDPQLTPSDRLVLDQLLHDVDQRRKTSTRNSSVPDATGEMPDSGYASADTSQSEDEAVNGASTLRSRKLGVKQPIDDYQNTIEVIHALADAQHADFEPTVFMLWDLRDIKLPSVLDIYLLQPYIRWGRKIARHETDVVMITHLLLYLSTSIPSALYLYYSFHWWHGIAHTILQAYYVGTYTLMMHQHIHHGGILARRYSFVDRLFPYILDPLFGHTWNSYYFHHVKHHHVEGNGPNDISSTIRYQRDDPLDFAIYVSRFLLLVWIDLPLAFIRKGQWKMVAKTAASEFSTYGMYILLALKVSWRPTLFVFLLPFALIRLGLMVGNWGQHCFVDEVEPDSDFRSSITLIDVPSNRFCFNDGYHTSHHLNPRRHWRDHPLAFLKQKDIYAAEHALVFRNIDYLMITFRVLRKDYEHLARCLVPIGDQIGKSNAELAAMLQTKTRKFSEEDIRKKFGKA